MLNLPRDKLSNHPVLFSPSSSGTLCHENAKAGAAGRHPLPVSAKLSGSTRSPYLSLPPVRQKKHGACRGCVPAGLHSPLARAETSPPVSQHFPTGNWVQAKEPSPHGHHFGFTLEGFSEETGDLS